MCFSGQRDSIVVVVVDVAGTVYTRGKRDYVG